MRHMQRELGQRLTTETQRYRKRTSNKVKHFYINSGVPRMIPCFNREAQWDDKMVCWLGIDNKGSWP